MTATQASQVESCPACEGEDIDRSIADLDGVCTQCGYVVQDGSETTPPDWLVPSDQAEQSNQQSWAEVSTVRNATEEQLIQAFATLEELGDSLPLDVSLRREAADVYCEAFLAKTTDGRDTTCVVAACVRLASLECEQPIPTGRITELPSVDAKQFQLSYAALCEDLDRTPPVLKPVDYVPFLAGRLGLTEEQRRAGTRRLEKVAGEPSLVGKDPVGIAAGALYLSSDETTQSDVADAAGVSTETIRQRVAQLRELVSNA